jgi:hypothetical protein
MAKRRKVTTVTLTPEQRERLERLWFYFGNYGPKTTLGNHSFIQRLLVNGIEERSIHAKRTPKSEVPSHECEIAVEAVLTMKTGSAASGERDGGSSFRLINNTEEHRRADAEPEMKAVLDDMKRRYSVMRARLEDDDDTLHAA